MSPHWQLLRHKSSWKDWQYPPWLWPGKQTLLALYEILWGVNSNHKSKPIIYLKCVWWDSPGKQFKSCFVRKSLNIWHKQLWSSHTKSLVAKISNYFPSWCLTLAVLAGDIWGILKSLRRLATLKIFMKLENI